MNFVMVMTLFFAGIDLVYSQETPKIRDEFFPKVKVAFAKNFCSDEFRKCFKVSDVECSAGYASKFETCFVAQKANIPPTLTKTAAQPFAKALDACAIKAFAEEQSGKGNFLKTKQCEMMVLLVGKI